MNSALDRVPSAWRLYAPVLVLAALPLLVALRFGGYHPRTAGWVAIGLVIWACLQGARGQLSAPRSLAGLAMGAFVALVAWTTASIGWVDASAHDAWVEAMRAAGYAAMFVLGGSLLANSVTYVRFATLTGVGIAVLGAATALRLIAGDSPLRAFVAGRLDWPIGYAPALGGLYLFGMLLLLGVSCAAERQWLRDRSTVAVGASGLALGGAACCASLAFLSQSRGTAPALLVGVLASLIVIPDRRAWILRFVAILATLVALRARLAAPFRSQFDLRQAPFTEGADEDALLETAIEVARSAGVAVLLALALAALLGAAVCMLAEWLGARSDRHAHAARHPAVLPVSVGLAALVGTLALTAATDRSPTAWVADQWRGCTNPPERVNDPGSGSSYFANTGTGRCDYYRVAFDNFRDEPLLGVGAGNFRSTYVRERETAEQPRVAHSLPLQLLGELGIVGGLLGATILGCVCIAASRFVRSGPERDPAFAGAIGAGAYWVAHASIDWLWQLPSISLPAIALAGGLVACVSPAQSRVRAAVAAPIAIGIALAGVALILPVTMADADLRAARDPELRRTDPDAALEAARSAQQYDPTWAEPAITEAALHAAAGRRAEAAAAARRAVRLEPRSWYVQYQASGLIGLDDTQEGLAAFQAARRLNPQLQADVKADDTAARQPAPDALQNPNG